MSFWVTFTDHSAGCVELVGEERPALPVTKGLPPEEQKRLWGEYRKAEDTAVRAKAMANKPDKEIANVQQLPYPANPRIGTTSSCPPFCWQPASCQGRSACPRRISCTE